LSDECKDFISQLLDKSPESRLGSCGGMDEVMKHPWLNGIDFAAIYEKKMTPPFKPHLSDDPLDVSNFKKFTQKETETTFIPEELKIKVSVN